MGQKTTYLIVAKNQTSGISNVMNNMETNKAIFNLNGQRVEKAQKGIYITQGRKVILAK
jgi:hypothetical protein